MMLTPGAASAQPAPDVPAPEEDRPAPDPNVARAQQLYRDGDTRYAEGRYEEAVTYFREAYELSPQPLLLFNLANAYERMGAYQEAADALSKYLDTSEVEGAEVIRQRLRQIERRAMAKQAEQKDLADLRARLPCADPVSCDIKEKRSSWDRTAYVLFGTGGVLLVASVVFALTARTAGDDALKACSVDDTRLCPVDAKSAIDRQKRFALFADLSGVLAFASVGTGVYFLLKHRAAERRQARIAPAFYNGGLGVRIAGNF